MARFLSIATVLFSLTIAGTAQAACRDYNSQAEAQRAFESNPSAYSALDRDHDRLACETYDYSGSTARAPSTKKPAARARQATTPSVSGNEMGRPKAYWGSPTGYVRAPRARYFTQWGHD